MPLREPCDGLCRKQRPVAPIRGARPDAVLHESVAVSLRRRQAKANLLVSSWSKIVGLVCFSLVQLHLPQWPHRSGAQTTKIPGF